MADPSIPRMFDQKPDPRLSIHAVIAPLKTASNGKEKRSCFQSRPLGYTMLRFILRVLCIEKQREEGKIQRKKKVSGHKAEGIGR